MATVDEILSNVADAVEVVYDSLLRASTLVTDINSYVGKATANLIGARGAQSGAAMKQIRANFAGLVPQFKSVLDPHVYDLQETTGYRKIGTIDQEWWEFFRDYCDDNAKSIKTRDLIFGAVAAGGGNTGDGNLYILTTNRLTEDIEGVEIATYQAECIKDQNLGTSLGREVFQMKQTPTREDILEDGGAGETPNITALAGDLILQNSSFQTPADTVAAPEEVPSWTYSGTTTTQLEFVLGTVAAGTIAAISPEEDSQDEAYSLKVKATGGAQTLHQDIRDLNASLDPEVPMFASIAVNQSTGSGTGSMALDFGNATKAVADVTTLPAGFSEVMIAADQTLWFENFNVDPLRYNVDLNIASGYILLDKAILAPWTAYRGIWYAILGGGTPFLKGDTFSNAVSLNSTEGKIQLVFYVIYGVYLQAAAVPSQADP